MRLLLILLSALYQPLAFAGEPLDLYLGVAKWKGEVKGETGEKDNATTLDDLGFDVNRYNIVWLNLEHRAPVIPQLRLMYSDINTTADAVITQPFALGGIIFEADVRTISKLVLSHADATFYYEILDNWLELDLGVTARTFDGYVEAESELTPPTRSTLAGSLPMLYLNSVIHIPGTGAHFGATANVIRYRGDGFHDYSARIGYLADFGHLDLGINLGYRELYLDVAEFDDLYVDASVSGAYLEILMHF